jgi:hypothetical protein
MLPLHGSRAEAFHDPSSSSTAESISRVRLVTSGLPVAVGDHLLVEAFELVGDFFQGYG